MKNRVIHKKSFLGFNIYKRVCLYEKKIETKIETKKFKYAGLYALSVIEDFSYDFVTFKEAKDWDDLTVDTLFTSFFMLFVNQNIEIIYFEDEISVFYKKSKKKKKGFYFKSLSNENIQSKYLKNIYRIITNSEINYKADNTIKKTIDLILDYYIGDFSRKKLEKKFVIKIIGDVAYFNDWISIKKESKILGFLNNYEIELSNEIKNDIKKEYDEIEKMINSLILQNKMFAIFTKKIKKLIAKEFFQREMNNPY